MRLTKFGLMLSFFYFFDQGIQMGNQLSTCMKNTSAIDTSLRREVPRSEPGARLGFVSHRAENIDAAETHLNHRAQPSAVLRHMASWPLSNHLLRQQNWPVATDDQRQEHWKSLSKRQKKILWPVISQAQISAIWPAFIQDKKILNAYWQKRTPASQLDADHAEKMKELVHNDSIENLSAFFLNKTPNECFDEIVRDLNGENLITLALDSRWGSFEKLELLLSKIPENRKMESIYALNGAAVKAAVQCDWSMNPNTGEINTAPANSNVAGLIKVLDGATQAQKEELVIVLRDDNGKSALRHAAELQFDTLDYLLNTVVPLENQAKALTKQGRYPGRNPNTPNDGRLSIFTARGLHQYAEWNFNFLAQERLCYNRICTAIGHSLALLEARGSQELIQLNLGKFYLSEFGFAQFDRSDTTIDIIPSKLSEIDIANLKDGEGRALPKQLIQAYRQADPKLGAALAHLKINESNEPVDAIEGFTIHPKDLATGKQTIEAIKDNSGNSLPQSIVEAYHNELLVLSSVAKAIESHLIKPNIPSEVSSCVGSFVKEKLVASDVTKLFAEKGETVFEFSQKIKAAQLQHQPETKQNTEKTS